MRENISKRKNIRLKDYDYSKEGMYFITICIKNRAEILGKIKNINLIELTREGRIVQMYLEEIENIFENIVVDEYVIMPNHIHMIITIVRKGNSNISKIMQQYKGYVSKKIGYSIWQKLFYEHIIRNEKEYYRVKKYIQSNIINWEKDKYY